VIVYEVNLFVQSSIAADYRAWLDSHIREILALPGFVGAELLELREPAPEAGEVALTVQYRLRDEQYLADYLREHAPRLRADGIARFGAGFRAQRRILARREIY